MHVIAEVFRAYPASLITVLFALLAPVLILVGIGATLAKREGGRGLAIATTAVPALMLVLSMLIQGHGASAGISDGVDGWMMADPASRSMLLSQALSTSMWAIAFGCGALVFLLPCVALGGLLVWGVRARRAGGPVLGLVLGALGAVGPAFLVGSAVANKVRGFTQMFGALAHVEPEQRGEMAAAGIAEIHSHVASGAGIVVLFFVGFLVAAAGAAMAARKEAVVPGWAIGVAALVAVAGVGTAGLAELRAGYADQVQEAHEAMMDMDPEPPDAPAM